MLGAKGVLLQESYFNFSLNSHSELATGRGGLITSTVTFQFSGASISFALYATKAPLH